jgi:hypothetical protein
VILTPDRLQALLQELFPIGTDGVELHLVGADEGEAGELRVQLQLVHYEDVDGIRQLLEIREQSVALVPLAVRDEPERVVAYGKALARVLPLVLAQHTDRWFLPSDLIPYDALMLARAETEEDFVRALQAKSRLGRYLLGDRGGAGPQAG